MESLDLRVVHLFGFLLGADLTCWHYKMHKCAVQSNQTWNITFTLCG